MGKTSRNKGKRGEREFAKLVQEIWGAPARRSAQVDGGLSADIVDGPRGLHIEVKRTSRLPRQLATWLIQADVDAREKVPVLAFREDGGRWWIATPMVTSYSFVAAVDRAFRMAEAVKGLRPPGATTP